MIPSPMASSLSRAPRVSSTNADGIGGPLLRGGRRLRRARTVGLQLVDVAVFPRDGDSVADDEAAVVDVTDDVGVDRCAVDVHGHAGEVAGLPRTEVSTVEAAGPGRDDADVLGPDQQRRLARRRLTEPAVGDHEDV